MVKPRKKKVEKLKKQDKKLSELPSLKEEKTRFEKGESFLKRLLRPRKLEVNVKEVRRSSKALSKKARPAKKKQKKR
jgi:hypothetical protein